MSWIDYNQVCFSIFSTMAIADKGVGMGTAATQTEMVGIIIMSCIMENLTLRFPIMQVRHKLGCTATEDGKRLEILDTGSRGSRFSHDVACVRIF